MTKILHLVVLRSNLESNLKTKFAFSWRDKISKFATPAATFSAMKFDSSRVGAQARKGEIYAKIGVNLKETDEKTKIYLCSHRGVYF
nr:hypothetical protein [uncultured Campylobacter sp.]